jgi:hypothetical protein
MSDEQPQDFQDWLQNLTVRASVEQMRSMQRYNDMIQRIIRGELNEQEIREEYMRFASEETARYIRSLATLSASYYSALTDLTRNYNDRFFARVMQRAVSGSESSSPEPQRVAMDLRGKIGETIVGSFVIENNRVSATEISFVVSEFAGPEGTDPFRPPLQIQPPHFMLEPKEERTVSLNLPLLQEVFAPGQQYTAAIVVRGYGDLELMLTVFVEPVATEPAQPGVIIRPAVSPVANEPEAETAPPAKAARPKKARRQTSTRKRAPKAAVPVNGMTEETASDE